jgi:hypothetical protein
MLTIHKFTKDGAISPAALITTIKIWDKKMEQVFPGRFYFDSPLNVYQFSWSGNLTDGEVTVFHLPCSSAPLEDADILSQKTSIYDACVSAVTQDNPTGTILYNTLKKRKINFETDFVFRILPAISKDVGALLRSNLDGKIYFFPELHPSFLYGLNYYAEFMERPFTTNSTYAFGKKLVVALCSVYGGIPLPPPAEEIKISALCNVDFAIKVPERTVLDNYHPDYLVSLETLGKTLVSSQLTLEDPSKEELEKQVEEKVDKRSLLYILANNGLDKGLVAESLKTKEIINIKVDAFLDLFQDIKLYLGILTVTVYPGNTTTGFCKLFNVDSINILYAR